MTPEIPTAASSSAANPKAERRRRSEARARRRFPHHLLHRRHARERLLGVERSHRRAKRRHDGGRVRRRPHEDVHPAEVPVLVGDVDVRPDAVPFPIANVAHDPDNRVPWGVAPEAPEPEPLADRVAAGPETPGRRLVDEHDLGRVRAVGGVEEAAALQRDPHRAEVTGADGLVVGGGIARLLFRGLPLDRERVVPPDRIHERPQQDEARRFDAGNLADLLEHAREKGRAVRHVGIDLAGEVDARGDQVLRIEARLQRGQARVAADHERGTRQQRERERHLGHDEPAAQAAGPAGLRGAARAFADRLAGVRRRKPERGHEAGDQDRRGGGGEREGHDRNVEADAGEVRHLARDARRKRADSGGRQHQTEHGAGQRDHGTLGQQLSDEPPARGAEGRPHGHLVAPPCRAGEQQVCHVGACDQEHEPNRTQEKEQRGPRVAVDLLRQRDDRRADAAVFLRILALERHGDGVHLGACLLDRHSGRQARDHLEDAQIARPGHDGDGGPPDVRAMRQGSVRREDADHDGGIAVEQHRLPDDSRVGAELPLPEAVRD